jgi:DNA-binding CsgD family transcriptional regulator
MPTDALRPAEIAHRLVGVHTVDRRGDSCIGLDRGPGGPPFNERERELLRLFLAGCPGFHREQLLARALAYLPLSRREQDVLGLLLTDLDENAAAHALGLTWRTTHQYAVSITRKFGVRGRRGLMAHWLRHETTRRPERSRA